MPAIDEWHDWLRLFVMLTCLLSLTLLVLRIWQHRNDWNTKTRDLWFSVLMWTLTGIILAAQGIVLDFDLQPAMVSATAASLVGFKALKSRDKWGGNENE